MPFAQKVTKSHTSCSTENHFKIQIYAIHSLFTEYEVSALYHSPGNNKSLLILK